MRTIAQMLLPAVGALAGGIVAAARLADVSASKPPGAHCASCHGAPGLALER